MTDAAAVRLAPIRPDWADALVEGDEAFSQRFGIPVEPGWEGFPDALPILAAAARSDGDPAWGPHLFFGAYGALVGNGGWKGPPESGVAEIGYAVSPSRQRRGIATNVVAQLLGQARRAGVTTVCAHTLAEENASAKVLIRSGFTRTDELNDPDEGAVWRWEIDLTDFSVREGHPAEWESLREIEETSDRLFLEVGIGPFKAEDEDDHFDSAAVVLVAGDPRWASPAWTCSTEPHTCGNCPCTPRPRAEGSARPWSKGFATGPGRTGIRRSR